MDEPDIITVDESNFEFQVLAYSERVPVLVNFWAKWDTKSQASISLLESLALQYVGRFRLAKVDVDENPQLTQRYQVHTVPTLKTFENGMIITQMEGLRTNLQVIEFVKGIAPGPEDLLIKKAASYLESGQYAAVEETCLEILDEKPGHPDAKLLLAKSLIWQGEYLETLTILNHFPPSTAFQGAEKLRPFVEQMLTEFDQDGLIENPLDPVYFRAIDLIQRHKIPAGLDGLLGLIRKNRNYRSGIPHKVILGIFELLGEGHPVVVEYRPLLANTLF